MGAAHRLLLYRRALLWISRYNYFCSFPKLSIAVISIARVVLLDFAFQGMRWIGKLNLEMFSSCYRGFKYTVTNPDIAHLALLCPCNKPDLEKVYISLIFSRLKFLVHSKLLPISIELAEDSTESRLLQRMWLEEREHSQSSCPTDSQLLKQSFQLIDSWLLQFILRIAQYPHVTRFRSTKSNLKPLFHLPFGLVWDWTASEKVSRMAFFHLPCFRKGNMEIHKK